MSLGNAAAHKLELKKLGLFDEETDVPGLKFSKNHKKYPKHEGKEKVTKRMRVKISHSKQA